MTENNHAEVKGSVMGQSFSITTKDVISFLLLIMICLAGWFAWQAYNANRPQEEQLPLGLPLPTEQAPKLPPPQ
jgi:predicted negative regulator of RcsB-dependent stress response